ncbi:MAG: phosphoribosylglycinamide formyltransferase [Gemmatimonadaceae bacterium]
MRARLAVLASGGGSNLQAILDYFASLGERRAGDVVLVASDRRDAKALDRARVAGIEAVHLDATAREHELQALFQERGIGFIVLAGYLRLVPGSVIAAYRGRVMNTHPALLPAFGGAGMYGERVHAAVLSSGARVTGATVHFVDEQYDRGAIIAQWPVAVAPNDTPASLASRVLAVEHLLYPRVVQAVTSGRIALAADGRVCGVPHPDTGSAFTLGDYVGLRAALETWLTPPL